MTGGARSAPDEQTPDVLDVRIQLPSEQMAVMLADLEGYIERRAQEIAKPFVEYAERSAAAEIAKAQAEATRWQDCNRELRRILDTRERMYNVLAEKHGERTIQ